MGLYSKVEGVMVSKYFKFELNSFDSIEDIKVCKNFNLGLQRRRQRRRRRPGDSISSHFLRKVELKSNSESWDFCLSC